MVERQQRPTPPGAAPPTDAAPPAHSLRGQRRIFDGPANDNTMSTARRIARAALFVLIGGALAWLLREIFG